MARILIILLLFVVSLSASQLTVNEQINQNSPLTWFEATGKIDTTFVDNNLLFISKYDTLILDIPIEHRLLNKEITVWGRTKRMSPEGYKVSISGFSLDNEFTEYKTTKRSLPSFYENTPQNRALYREYRKHQIIGVGTTTIGTFFTTLSTIGLVDYIADAPNVESDPDKIFDSETMHTIQGVFVFIGYTLSLAPTITGINQFKKARKAKEVLQQNSNKVDFSLGINPLKKEIALVGEF